VYQIRSDSPDGQVVKEDLLVSCESGWIPFGEDYPLRKIYGMPMAFGVPKGAKKDGQLLPNQNVFAVKMYRHGLLERDGMLLNVNHHPEAWPDIAKAKHQILRVCWLQFRLNETEDDIEIIQPLQQLRQAGYESGESFCSLVDAEFMNHAMTPPVQTDNQGLSWLAVETFKSIPTDLRTHGVCATVEYYWNQQTGLYEWKRTGKIIEEEGLLMGETSISKFEDLWIIALRTWSQGGVTVWYKTDDPFTNLGKPTLHKTTWGPRHSYRCADGVLRIFKNDQNLSPYKEKRNPLYAFEVNTDDFSYSQPITLFDAHKELPFDPAFCDMSKLCPAVGNKQLLFFRAIDQRMTTEDVLEDQEDWQKRMAIAGIHAVELEYDFSECERYLQEGREYAPPARKALQP